MALTNDEVISTLNNLIETCKDGQEGFQAATEGIHDGSVKKILQQYAQERAQFVGELQNEVRRLGGDPEKTGSVAGALHRGWMNIKTAVTGKDEHAVLEECERGEDSAVENYREAMAQGFPTVVLGIVQRQFDSIQQAHDRIRRLRDSTNVATAKR